MMRRRTGLVVALDVPTEARALRVARDVGEVCDGLKVGVPLVLGAGAGVLRRLGRFGYVLADMKVADVPHTNRAIAGRIFRSGADGLIVQGFPGPDSLRACIGVARAHRGDVFVVAEMSHPGGRRFTAPASEAIGRMAKREGAHGLVAPATRPERIRALRRASGLPILSPGVGVQGGDPAAAIRAGASWLVAGRSVVGSRNPRRAAEALVEAIRRARGR